MNTSSIEIRKVEPMRVASAYGFGTSPEAIAWQKMVLWAKPKGLLNDINLHPIYGFNNPYPTPDHPKYGYELWMKVGPDTEPEGDIRIGEFFGGLYAVARCEVHGNPENIPLGWMSLAEWCKKNDHPTALHHALEKFLTGPDDLDRLVMELFCPIAG